MTATSEEIKAAFAAYGCPGTEACPAAIAVNTEVAKRLGVSEVGHVHPCEACPAPKRVKVNDVVVYRSYADYCDD